MDEAWARAAELVMRLPQEYRRVPAADVIEPEEWGQNLQSAMLVVRDQAATAAGLRERTCVMSEASRFGVFAVPPLHFDDYFFLRHALVEVYHWLITKQRLQPEPP
jgi:hypothetical protein